MRDRQVFKSYVPSALRKRVRQYAAKKGVSESSVTNAALLRYLEDANDVPLILRKLDRLDRKVTRVRTDSDVLTEAFAVFVQTWFASTPRLAASEKAPAEESARLRFGEFLDAVAENLAGGGSFSSASRSESADGGEDE
jgi:hypothetical protein